MDWTEILFTNWPVKLVCGLLIVAAYIDGKQLRVPNWLTYPMVFSGLIYSAWAGGWAGFQDGFFGMLVGLACLLPLYAVGGMGAGDVKLLAGVGAWMGVSDDLLRVLRLDRRGGRHGRADGALQEERLEALLAVAADPVGMAHDQESQGAFADCRGAQADDAAYFRTASRSASARIAYFFYAGMI